MPKKSILEMSDFERKHYSIGGKTFRAIILISLVLGIAAVSFGLYLYSSSINREYRIRTWNMSRATAIGIDKYEVMREAMIVSRIYDSLSEEERRDDDSEEYKAKFSEVSDAATFANMRIYLYKLMQANDARAAYTALLDREGGRMIFLADADTTDSYCAPGTWDYIQPDVMNALFDGAPLKFLDRLYGVEQMTSVPAEIEDYGYRCTAGTKLFDIGKYSAFIFYDTDMNVVRDISKVFLLQYVVILLLVTVLVTIIILLRIRRTIVTPIDSLAGAAYSFIEDRNDTESRQPHFNKLNIKTGDEIENLAMAMKIMESDLGKYVENLTKITAEKERVSTELDIAREIQEGMLPSIFPPFPEHSEFDIFASMDPAKEVGGDFYDFFLVDDDHLGLVMADVSGKGVPAAMFMMASKILIANFTNIDCSSPGKALARVNDSICSNNKADMFVTVWLGILEISTGKLTAANAGHEYPAIKKANGKYELLKDKHGFVIGGMDGMDYTDYVIQMEPGDALFLYTDGVAEAMDADRNMFGTDRMLDALNADPGAQQSEQLVNVRKAIDAFVKDAPQFDDITMLGLKYKGPEK